MACRGAMLCRASRTNWPAKTTPASGSTKSVSAAANPPKTGPALINTKLQWLQPQSSSPASRDDIGKVVVAGESAGAYLACLAAKSGVHADAYIFLGGHCDSGAAIYEYNFGRLVQLAEARPEWRTWAEKNARFDLALGRNYRQMFDAAAKGQKSFEVVDGDFKRTISLARRKEELDFPPDEMFRLIKQPGASPSAASSTSMSHPTMPRESSRFCVTPATIRRLAS